MSEDSAIEVFRVQEVDAVPVLDAGPASPRALDRRRSSYELIRSIAPTTQAAAVAAGGFIAGAALVGLSVRRRGLNTRALGRTRHDGPRGGRRRSAARGRRGAAGAGELVRIVGTRSLLVDVHLLDRAGR